MWWLGIRAAMGAFVPAWLPYLLAALMALGGYLYLDSSIRSYQRAVDHAEMSKEKDAAQKHFAERASKLAADADALRLKHAAEIAERDAIEQALAEQWRLENEKNSELQKQTCWPLAIVKELRK